MTTHLEKKKRPAMPGAGRPEIEIDMKVVDDLLISGCNGCQVAAYLGVHEDTLYNQIKRNYGINFSDYTAKKRSKGDAMIHAAQFRKALKQDNTMMVWLGKNRLGQRDTPVEMGVSAETMSQFGAVLSQLKLLRSEPNSDLKIEDKSNSAEQKS